MQLRSLVALIIAVVTAISSHAWAWDAEGHRIIAHLAYERLTPKAKAEIATLIAHWSEQGAPWCPVANLEDASWPDCIRPMHSRWEYLYGGYVDIPICGFEPTSVWCRSGVCVIDDTKRALAILKDPTKPAADRLEALEEVTHFVGDMHQRCTPPTIGPPTMCPLPFWSSVTYLHHDWDMEVLVNAEGTSESAAEAALEPLVRRNAAKWARGDLDAWVAETHALAVSYVYPKLAQPPKCGVLAPEQTISRAYLDGAAPLVREQLGRAAVRLAVVLNRAIG